ATPARSLSKMLITVKLAEVDRARFDDAREAPDSGETRGKRLAPGRLETREVGARRDGEHQLEVLAVGQRVRERRALVAFGQRARGGADRNGGCRKRGHGVARSERGQVLGEPVAEVHERTHFVAPGEPRALRQARGETMMVAEDAAAQRARDVDPVSGFCAVAGEHARAARFADQGETRDEARGLMRDVAAYDRHAVGARDGGESAVEPFEPARANPRVEGECNDRGAGLSAHRGEVAEVALEELGGDGPR